MKNRLFLVCPDACMEAFLSNHYDESSFFLTALGTIFRFEEPENQHFLKEFIEQEKITDLYFVKDASCRFVRSVVDDHTGYKTYAEKVMLDTLIDNYPILNLNSSTSGKIKALSFLVIREQVRKLLNIASIRHKVSDGQLRIKGLLTTKSQNLISEIEFTLKDFGNEYKITP